MKIFLQVNLLLAISYFFFVTAYFIFYRFAKNTGAFRQWVITAQLLVLTSVSAPALFSFLPTQNLPKIELRVLDPLPESFRTDLRRRLKSSSRMSSAQIKPASLAGTPSLWEKVALFFNSSLAYLALLHLWGAGSLFSLGRLTMRIRKLFLLTQNGIIVRRLGRVSILISDAISTPFSVLLGAQAWVVVPTAMVTHADDYRVAVRHELQHHRHRDTAWALVVEVFCSLFFANPFIYLWKKRIVELQEFSCDESLLGQGRLSAQEYGSCLVRVAEATLRTQDVLVGTTGMAAGAQNPEYFKSFLRRRVEMFASHTRPPGHKKIGAVLGTLIMLGTVVVAYGSQRSFRPREVATVNPGNPEVDPEIQKIADIAVQAAVHDLSAKAGFVIVADPMSGRILAVANTRRDGGPDVGRWALSYLVEPASEVKTLVAASAVEKKVASFTEVFDCGHGTYPLGKHVFHDYTDFDHLTTTETVVKSSNICGIKIGEKLGPAGLAQAMASFGIGAGGSTIGFPGALAGTFPSPDQMDANDYIPLLSTGYSGDPGFYASPLELVQAYGVIANGGKLMKPLEANAPDSAITSVRQVLSADNAKQWRQTLARAVTNGTGTHAESIFYTTAGKTSTAYRPNQDGHANMGGEKAVGGFIGFAPVEHPRIVVYAAVVDALARTEGNIVAAPLFRDVTERVLKHLNVPQDRGN